MSASGSNAVQEASSIDDGGGLIPVKVALRVRPLSEKEKLERSALCMRFVEGEPQVILGKDRSFTYDFVFPPDIEQQQVFEDCVEPLVQTFFQGYNATILAYGQTGSGKTYSMGSGNNTGILPRYLGIIPRYVNKLFERVSELKAQDESKEYKFKVSFLELYNEEIRDMLTALSDASQSRPPLQIREDANGVYIAGLREMEVNNRREMLDALTNGSLSRTTGATLMNQESSRSHAVFTVIMQESKQGQESAAPIISKFHFVDLAGSERLARTKAEGVRMKEGISINSGLLALGNVINALCDEKRRGKHIPYRDSKLTRLLQDSLGGNSRTLMIACTSPADTNFEETLNTLKYADRARQIKNKPIVNMDPVAIELAKLKKMVQALQAELQVYRSKPDNPATTIVQLQQRVQLLEEENQALRAGGSESTIGTSSISRQKVRESDEFPDSSDGTMSSSYEHSEGRETPDGTSMNEYEDDDDHLAGLSESTRNLLMNLQQNNFQLQLDSEEQRTTTTKQTREEVTVEEEYNEYTFSDEEDDGSTIHSNNTKVNDEQEPSEASTKDNSTDDDLEAYGIFEDFDDDSSADSLLYAGLSETTQALLAELEKSHFDSTVPEAVAKSKGILDELDNDIKAKEALITELSKDQSRYEQLQREYAMKISAMEQEIHILKDTLREVESISEITEEEKIHMRRQYEQKMETLKGELGKLGAQQIENERLMKENAESEARVRSLSSELDKLKKTKVELIKRMKEESKLHLQTQQQHKKELAKLLMDSKKSQKVITELLNKTKQQDSLIQRKQNEIQQTQKKLKDFLDKRTTVQKMKIVSQTSSTTTTKRVEKERKSTKVKSSIWFSKNTPTHKAWIASQLAQAFRVITARETLNRELRKREALVEEVQLLQNRKQELENAMRGPGTPRSGRARSSSTPPSSLKRNSEETQPTESQQVILKQPQDDGLSLLSQDVLQSRLQEVTSQIDNTETAIDYQNEKISKSQKILLDVDNNPTFAARIKQFSLDDCKHFLKYTFEFCLNSMEQERQANERVRSQREELLEAKSVLAQLQAANTQNAKRLLPLDSHLTLTGEQSVDQVNALIQKNISLEQQNEELTRQMQQLLQLFNVQGTESEASSQPSPTDLSPRKETTSVQQEKRSQQSTMKQEDHSKSVHSQANELAFSSTKTLQLHHSVNIEEGTPLKTSKPASATSKVNSKTQPMQCLEAVSAHEGAVYSLAVQGNLMFSTGQDTKIKQWDLSTWRDLREFQGHQKAVVASVCSDNLLFTAGKDKLIKLWDTKSAQCVKTVLMPTEISSLLLVNNLLFAGLDGTIKVWDLRGDVGAMKNVKNLTHHKGTIFALFANKKYLFSGSRDHYVEAFDIKTLEFHQTLQPPHYDSVNCFCGLGDDNYLLSGSRDKAIKLWNTSGETIVQEKVMQGAHQDWVNAMYLMQANSMLYTASRDGSITCWNWNMDGFVQASHFQAHSASVNSAIGFGSDLLLTASADRSIKLWRPSDLL